MPLSRIKETWMESSILKSCGIVVQGGEYTLHPEALPIMKFFYELLPKVTLLTNAVDPDLVYPLVGYAHQITISLDGSGHDKARGVKGNRDNILKLLSELPVSRKKVTVQMTLGPWNASTIEMALHNVDWVLDVCTFYRVQPRFNIASDDGLLGTANYSQKKDVLTNLFGEMTAMSNLNKYSNVKDSLRDGANYIMAAVTKEGGFDMTCHSTSIYSTINADGSVLLCQGLDVNEATVGNIYSTPFDVIWDRAHPRREEYRGCQKCTLSCQLNGDLKYAQELKKSFP
jgi:MoaA/NifB/PqqE/SkfB family radical SAM enzyme